MIVLGLVAALIIAALFVRDPGRTAWGVVCAVVATLVLVEFAGIRLALSAGAILGTGVALSGGRRVPAGPPPPSDDATPMARAWSRLMQVGGFWSRNRIVALKARYEAVAVSTAGCDPFSEAGEMRIKLDRYVPELIDTMLDERMHALPARRRAITAELLAELDRFVSRMEAVDPANTLRANRRTALRNHLRGSDDAAP